MQLDFIFPLQVCDAEERNGNQPVVGVAALIPTSSFTHHWFYNTVANINTMRMINNISYSGNSFDLKGFWGPLGFLAHTFRTADLICSERFSYSYCPILCWFLFPAPRGHLGQMSPFVQNRSKRITSVSWRKN